MRSSITLFDDQYDLYKNLKSKKLLIAFVEFMFEDIEPKNLNNIEKSIFNSLRERMENSKKKHDGNAKGGRTSHGGGRIGNTSSNLHQENKSKTTQKQLKNNEEEEEDILSNDNILEEEEEEKINKKKINKKRFLDFVLLSDDEYTKLTEKFGIKHTEQLIDKLNNYIGSTGKRYKSHYYTILNRSKNEVNTTTHDLERERQIELHRQKIREQIDSFNSQPKQNAETGIQTGGYNRRENIRLSDIPG